MNTIYTIGYGNRMWKQVREILLEKIPPDFELGTSLTPKGLFVEKKRPIQIFDVRAFQTGWCNDWKHLDKCVHTEPDMYYLGASGVGNSQKLEQTDYKNWIQVKDTALQSFTNIVQISLKAGSAPVFLCACMKDFLTRCHRVPLAELVTQKLECEVVHL